MLIIKKLENNNNMFINLKNKIVKNKEITIILFILFCVIVYLVYLKFFKQETLHNNKYNKYNIKYNIFSVTNIINKFIEISEVYGLEIDNEEQYNTNQKTLKIKVDNSINILVNNFNKLKDNNINEYSKQIEQNEYLKEIFITKKLEMINKDSNFKILNYTIEITKDYFSFNEIYKKIPNPFSNIIGDLTSIINDLTSIINDLTSIKTLINEKK